MTPLPDGHLAQSVNLMAAVEPAASRQARATFLDNAQANPFVPVYHENKRLVDAQAQTAADVFAQAVALPPRRFKTCLERTLFSGPTPRKDAEELERSRWIHTLATLLMDTPTPIGQILRSNSLDCQHLGAGRRASTLRSLVRYIRNFLRWLSSAHQKVFPTEVADLIRYLKVRREEPCFRGALRNTRRSFEFLEEVTCTAEAQKFTKTEVFQLMAKEILNYAEPGRLTKQAPRMFLCLMAGSENLVVSSSAAPYLRIFAWWICLQHWGTLRFSDHRGICPSSVSFVGIDFVATLSHAKTLRKDKKVQSRPVVVRGLAFLAVPGCLRTGWDFVKLMADFLLPTPSSCLKGCQRSELLYDTGSAVFYRTLCTIKLPGSMSLTPAVARDWTPHSRRSFLPASTASLGVQKSMRDFLGGWNAEGSDRYVRVANLRILNMHISVLSVKTSGSDDPIAETESLREFVEFLQSTPIADKQTSSLARAMETRLSFASAPLVHEPETFADPSVDPYVEVEQEMVPPSEPAKKKRGGHAQVRTAELGADPRSRRAELRSSMRQGHYLCFSGKKGIRTLHRLGSCYALPGVDYLRYEYLGDAFPPVASFDAICKLCGATWTTRTKTLVSFSLPLRLMNSSERHP